MHVHLTLALALAGGLAAQTQFRAGDTSPAATSTVFVDADNDGDLDLVQARASALVLRNNDGSGQFTDAGTLLGGIATPRLFTTDADGDGDGDVLVIPSAGVDAGLLLRNEPAGFVSAPLLASPLSTPLSGAIFVADFDGDTDPDVLLVAGIGPAALLRNDGSGSFLEDPSAFPGGSPLFIGSRPAVGDFDGNGSVDLLGEPALSGLMLNDGSGVFRRSPTPLPPLPAIQFRVAGDFNNDGIDDVFYSNDSATGVLLGDPSGTFVVGTPTSRGIAGLVTSLVPVDIDDDGDLDVFATGLVTNSIQLLVNDGTGSFGDGASRVERVSGLLQAFPGDVDGDGDSDLLVLSNSSQTPQFLLHNHHREVTIPAQPLLGSTLTLELSYAPGYGTGLGLALPVIGPEAGARIPSSFGTVWIDPNLATALPFVGLVGVNGDSTLTVPVPNEPGLVGLAFLAQALIFEPFDPSVSERITGFRRFVIQ